jgi:hypothetical protein
MFTYIHCAWNSLLFHLSFQGRVVIAGPETELCSVRAVGLNPSWCHMGYCGASVEEGVRDVCMEEEGRLVGYLH